MATSRPTRRLYALFGLVSTLVGMGVGHLTASLLTPDSSPVLAVGSGVIDRTPVSLKEWAIKNFESDGFSIGPIDFAARNYDKIVLVGSVFVGVLVLALVAGLLARRSFALGAGLLVVLVAVAAGAVLTRPIVEPLDVVPSLLTALAGVGALWWLHRTALGLPLDPRARSSVEVAKAEGARAAAADRTGEPTVDRLSEGPVAAPADADADTRPSRRGVLVVAAVLTASAAVLGGAGKWIIGLRGRPEDITLPEPTSAGALGPLPEGLEAKIKGITPLQVANGDFYRVDTRLDTPVVSSEDWTLTVDGDVENKLEISFEELLDMPMVERDITLTCVSNSVGGKYVGGARWLGVPLMDILDRAGIGKDADQMIATDFDGMTIGTPIDLLRDGREPLLCIGMNGEPLPREHGFPVRVVVPGLYGFISATKWVTRLTMTTYADTESYWTERSWDTRAPIKPSARIDTPRALTTVDAGKVNVGGVAWAQDNGGVMKVQVKVDGGDWADAELGPDVNNVYWRQWYREVEVEGGQHTISARVVDGDGQLQTDVQAAPFPGGSSGIHSFFFTAAS
ncbi:molybdopterin-dependent oxidoreductase [Nocardioides sp. 1609]|uniref:molybdopterin-dependent oxidoreductase n=1 Tax=Nocardioides sp. 1609 TaxID=2508327 RepID=UPI0010701625|nr:molybdopterin-dependent oxidoreductase [Nocardioides sp. 1609]